METPQTPNGPFPKSVGGRESRTPHD